MSDAPELYPDGARELQDHYGSRGLADRLAEITVVDSLDEDRRRFIEAQAFFFLATVDSDGFPDLSYKGGAPGFVRCPDDRTIVFPSYDGNGMFRSLGNIVDQAKVSLLFLRFAPNAARIRVHGTATVHTAGELVDSYHEAHAAVEVTVGRVFPNCPRYVHDPASGELSEYVPEPGRETPQPEWKTWDVFSDVV